MCVFNNRQLFKTSINHFHKKKRKAHEVHFEFGFFDGVSARTSNQLPLYIEFYGFGKKCTIEWNASTHEEKLAFIIAFVLNSDLCNDFLVNDRSYSCGCQYKTKNCLFAWSNYNSLRYNLIDIYDIMYYDTLAFYQRMVIQQTKANTITYWKHNLVCKRYYMLLKVNDSS